MAIVRHFQLLIDISVDDAARLGQVQGVLVDLLLLLFADAVPVRGDVLVAEERADLLERAAFGFGEEEVDDGEVDDGGAD